MLLHSIKSAVWMMRAKPLRSALSLLGIYAGALALLLILALQEGARRQFEELYRTEGARVYLALPSYDPSALRSGAFTRSETGRLVSERFVRSLLPRLTAEKEVRSRRRQEKASLLGIDADYIPLYRVPLVAGRLFLAEELRRGRSVCLLTEQSRRAFFPTGDAVGQLLNIQGTFCQVIGVVDWNAAVSQRALVAGEPDILVPISWMRRGRERIPIPMLEIRVSPSADPREALGGIYRALSHGDPRREKLFTVESLENYMEETRQSRRQMLKNLLTVAGVGLFVGAVGVANVMLISVLERTREVGLRKACGARSFDIVCQFLTESLVLTLTGGLLALATGSLGLIVFPVFFGHRPSWGVPPFAVLGCLGLLFMIGLVAGSYPASRAASLAPADALRTE